MKALHDHFFHYGGFDRSASRAADGQVGPIKIVDLELTEPLQHISSRDFTRRYVGAYIVVRLHTRPLGVLEMSLGADGLSPTTYAASLWEEFGAKINEHLRGDTLPEHRGLATQGLPWVESPPCLLARRALSRNAPKASIVVPTRDRPRALARCLRSLTALDYPNYEIIIVDGSTNDATSELIRERFPTFQYVRVWGPGVSYPRNRGVESASGTITAFTDDDVVADRNWLTDLVGAFDSHQRVACATGLVLPLELDTPAQVWFEESGAFTEGFDRRVVDLRASQSRDHLLPYATGRIGAGVNMAWRTSVLREMGGFDLALDACGAEDLAAFFDVLNAGFQIVYQPSAVVFHEHRREYEALRRQKYMHGLGLGAYLTRCIATQPKRAPHLAKRIPKGVMYGFSPASPRNRKKSKSFPVGLTRAERRGVMLGPFAYLKGVRRARSLPPPDGIR
jgi:GT2 family glycosyltransferase